MRSYAFIISLLFANNVFSQNLCGRYQASAKVINDISASKVALFFNQESANKIIVEISDPKQLIDKIGSTLDVTFFVEGFCTGRCKGELIKIEEVSSPFQNLKPFQQNEKNRMVDARCKF